MHLSFGWVFYLNSYKYEPGGSAAEGFGEDRVGRISLGEYEHVNGFLLDDAIGIFVQVVR